MAFNIYNFSPRRARLVPDVHYTNFFGLATAVKDTQALKRGFSPDSLNWMTGESNDHIELRRGTAALGQTYNNGNGQITGLEVGTKRDGTEIPFFSYARKLKYYNTATDDTVEISSDVLPAAANGEQIAIASYQNLAGSVVYFSSPNSSVYKVVVANPGSYKDQTITDHRGYIRAGQGRIFLWNKNSSANVRDPLSLYLSWVDKSSAADYQQVTGEAVGSLGLQHYSYTLTGITGVQTAFAVAISATVAQGTETFTDDGNGNLTSNFGGTGTINYTTGALDITFSAVTTGNVTASYFLEDSISADAGTANTGAPLDFSFDTPRTAGQGNVYSQTGAGNFQAIFPLGADFFCFHERLTWRLTLTGDDTASSNLPYRERMGIPFFRAACESPDGIYFLDYTDANRPRVRLLKEFATNTTVNTILPVEISQVLDLSPFDFAKAVVWEWGNYILVACQQKLSGVSQSFNSRLFAYNKKSKAWDLTDYSVSVLKNYLGTLLAGDSISNNVFTLFSGFDDDDAAIANYWTSHDDNLDVDGIKRFHRVKILGLIQTTQKCNISFSFDRGSFTKAFTLDGSANYVSKGTPTVIGSRTLGSKRIGADSANAFAYPFEAEFKYHSDKFERVRWKIEATDIGAIQINDFIFKDIRYQGRKSIPVAIAN